MDIHGVTGAGWSWMEHLEKVSMSFTASIQCTGTLPSQNNARMTKCAREGHAEHCVGSTALVLAASLKDNVHPYAGRL
jgi:hypothetical protein